jgi:hypothetical protein
MKELLAHYVWYIKLEGKTSSGTKYEQQVAVAAMDCQYLGVAQVRFPYTFHWYLENYVIVF